VSIVVGSWIAAYRFGMQVAQRLLPTKKIEHISLSFKRMEVRPDLDLFTRKPSVGNDHDGDTSRP
jgi:hypothetical protein